MPKKFKPASYRQREAEMVAGMIEGDKSSQYGLYKYCADYYYAKSRALFPAPEDVAEEVFQNAFITLWESIESGKISAGNGSVNGKDGKPLNCSIRTYFMSIARLKYLEWTHDHPFPADPGTELGRAVRLDGVDVGDWLYDDAEDIQAEIIADVVSRMPLRCAEILSKFYYEGKNLDCILREIPSIKSKNALKTKKNKCLDNLRRAANEIYGRYLKSS